MMYFRRTTYVFSLMCISLIIYLFQYIDTKNRKYTDEAEKSDPFYNSSVRGLLFHSKSRQHNLRRGKTLKRQNDVSLCENIIHRPLQSEILYRHTHWQVQQDGLQEEVVVYSAFYDDRPISGLLPCIRILGVRRLSRKTLWCHLWFPGKNNPVVVEAEIVKTGRNYPFPGLHVYSQNLFSCPLDNVDSYPTHVSIATERCGILSTVLKVITPKRSDEWSHQLGACLHLSSGNFPPEQVVEWMEIHSMFGLTRVNVYNGSLDGKLGRVFDYYSRKGFVDLRQMSPAVEPNDKNGDVTLSKSTSLNDCLMRNMYTHRFIVVADFDEIIVPRLHSSYMEMLDHLDRRSRLQNPHHTYSFRNAYFLRQFPEDTSQPGVLRTMRLRYRAKPSGYLVGPRSFVDPRRCRSLFNHNCLARSDKKDFLTINVDTAVALNHNYRSNCPFSRFRCEQYKREKIQDNIMLKFKDVLLRRVSSALTEIGVGGSV